MKEYSYLKTEVILFDYTLQGEKVASYSVDCYNGLTKQIIANGKTEKVKVYVHTSSAYGYDSYKWVQQVYYLEKGQDNNIIINGETIIGPKEP